jgi:hypothetical protein
MNARHLLRLALMFGAVLATASSVAFSQMGPGMGMGPGRGNRMYNPATETTIKGTVEETRGVAGRRGWAGMHLTVKTQSGTFDAHLGPLAYITQHGFKFAKGDQVEVTGSKTKYQGQDAIIAREIKKGGKVLTLRNAQGFPAWAGGRGMIRNAQQ